VINDQAREEDRVEELERDDQEDHSNQFEADLIVFIGEVFALDFDG
jgi:hypothetical protein